MLCSGVDGSNQALNPELYIKSASEVANLGLFCYLELTRPLITIPRRLLGRACRGSQLTPK